MHQFKRECLLIFQQPVAHRRLPRERRAHLGGTGPHELRCAVNNPAVADGEVEREVMPFHRQPPRAGCLRRAEEREEIALRVADVLRLLPLNQAQDLVALHDAKRRLIALRRDRCPQQIERRVLLGRVHVA